MKRTSRKRSLTFGILASLATQGCASSDTEAIPAIGALHTISISSDDEASEIKPMKFSVNDGATTVQAKSYRLDASDSDTSYIALHFSSFDLPIECTMEVADAQGRLGSTTTLTGKGRKGNGKFWARHIEDSSLLVTLKCNGDTAETLLETSNFQIDKYVAGYPNDFEYHHEVPTAAPTEGPTSSPTNGPTSTPTSSPTEDPTAAPTGAPTSGPTSGPTTPDRIQTSEVHTGGRSEVFNIHVNQSSTNNGGGGRRKRKRQRRKLGVCSPQDSRQSVACSSAGVEEQSRGVARLLIDGRFVCTGFLVSDNLLVTASICLDDEDNALDVDYEFQFQRQSCDDETLLERSEIYEGLEVVKYSETSDYAVIRLTGNPGAKYGYLQVADELPSMHEAVYVPQHKNGLDKQASENCVVLTNGLHRIDRTCSLGGSFKDISHTCDTDGAAIGSPVISQDSGLVMGMHHCSGTCPSNNFAVPGMEIHDALRDISQIHSNELQLVTSEEPQCMLSISTNQCGSVMHNIGVDHESCDCANFCGNEFLGCCEKGKECPVSCSGALVAGCSYKPPSLSHQHLVETHLKMQENLQAPEPWGISEGNDSELPSLATESYEQDSTGKDVHRLLRIR